MHWNPAVGLPLLVVGLIVLALIWMFGQPRKPGQGRRPSGPPRGSRREPTLDEAAAEEAVDAPGAHQAGAAHNMQQDPFQASLLETATQTADDSPVAPVPKSSPEPSNKAPGPSVKANKPASPAPRRHASPPSSGVGLRPEGLAVDRIVAIHVVAPADRWFQGPDLVVAADKAGLEFGHKGIFHRLLNGKRDQGPLFSVANMLQPGSFDLTQVTELSTSGLSFFMTLPGPAAALDAWDAMLPTAQRMAELLGGEVLDDEHNALGRQRIAHVRDDLRAWDRRHQGGEVGFDS